MDRLFNVLISNDQRFCIFTRAQILRPGLATTVVIQAWCSRTYKTGVRVKTNFFTPSWCTQLLDCELTWSPHPTSPTSPHFTHLTSSPHFTNLISPHLTTPLHQPHLLTPLSYPTSPSHPPSTSLPPLSPFLPHFTNFTPPFSTSSTNFLSEL